MSFGETLTLEALERDPEPLLARLRDEEPVAWVPALGLWLVTRWDDVEYVDRHPELFSATTEPSFLRRALGVNMMTLDAPEATRLKRAMMPPFQRSGASGRFASEVLPGMCDALIDGFYQVDEVLRRFTPVGTITRQATRDVALGGVTIPRGALVAGVLRSADLDERRWAEPTRIDIDRAEGGRRLRARRASLSRRVARPPGGRRRGRAALRQAAEPEARSRRAGGASRVRVPRTEVSEGAVGRSMTPHEHARPAGRAGRRERE